MSQTGFALGLAEQEMDGPEVGYLPVSPTELLRERLGSAIANTNFYRELYGPFGPPPSDGTFLEWFGQLPIISKSQLQAAGPAPLLNPLYDRAGLVAKLTSGSTGVPFTLYLDNTVIKFRKWRFQRPHQQIVRESPTKLVFIFPWDFVARTPRERLVLAESSNREPTSDQTTRPTDANRREGSASFSSLPKKSRRIDRATSESAQREQPVPILDRPFTVNSWLPPERLFAILAELEPATLIGFASSIAALARWMSSADRLLPSVKQVWTTSEILSPEGGDEIRSVFGCEPLSIYASNEFGFMAWQSAPGEPLCFDSDRLLVETIQRDNGLPARGDDLSRIVVTDLLNDTMPLIRYDIADIARPSEPIQVRGGVQCVAVVDLQGKEADLLQPSNGRIVTTFEILGTIKDNLPNAQYRFIGLDADRYILQYVPGPGFSADAIAPTIESLRTILGERAEIEPLRVAEIARESSGKLRPLINLKNVSGTRLKELAEKLDIVALLRLSDREQALGIVRRALTASRWRGDPIIDERLELYADLGMDSLRFISVIAELEREIGTQIDDEDILDVDLITVGDLVKFVERMISR